MSKLTPEDFGQASIMAAELVEGLTYPPHSVRMLARAYLELLGRIRDYQTAKTALETLPYPAELPKGYLEAQARGEIVRCKHGQLPAYDGRDTCIQCRWIAQGAKDSDYALCEHDRRADNCRRCEAAWRKS